VSAAATTMGCGSSGVTNTTGPTATRCQITVSNTPSSFGVSGGDGTVSISVDRECGWTAAAQAGWIAITSATAGQGAGSVTYHVAANPDPVIRSGSITVGDQHANFSQAAAPCSYTVTAPANPLASAGGDASVAVQANSVCAWTAAADASWVTVSPASGSGSGSVRLIAAPNGGAARTATVTVAGTRVTLTQLSGSPVSTPPPTPPAPAPGPTPPVPNPQPPAPPPVQIDLSGRVSGVQGTCPALTFTLANHTVRTSSATEFTGGPCKDLKNDTRLSLRGTLQSDGSVTASRVSFN
jgi:hypothetical protein